MYIIYVSLCPCNVFNSLLVINAHRHRVYLCIHAISTPTDGFFLIYHVNVTENI